MSTIHFHQTTTLTPEQYVAGLTDFGPDRSKLFANSADEYLKVHQLGRTEADVTEGSGGIWERLHYDWSDPNHVVLTTTDSNLWGGASGHTYNWAAGNSPSPVVAGLPFANRGGRIDTNLMLQVEIKEGVWALGDCASIPDGNGGFHPPTAQHALRQARTAARNLVASIRGEALKPFSFRTIGQLAAIGHRTGVGQLFGRRFSGFIAWWMWRTIYLSKLPRLEKRLRVVLDWTLDLVFAKDTVQYTSFRAFSQSTRSAPFHDPERSPHDSEPDDPPTSVGYDPVRSTIWKTEPIVADDFGSKSVSGIDIS